MWASWSWPSANPPAEAEIQAGDYLIVMGRHADLRKLEGLLTEVRA
jgi:Trk K+ transport system NAD-binding subunit